MKIAALVILSLSLLFVNLYIFNVYSAIIPGEPVCTIVYGDPTCPADSTYDVTRNKCVADDEYLENECPDGFSEITNSCYSDEYDTWCKCETGATCTKGSLDTEIDKCTESPNKPSCDPKVDPNNANTCLYGGEALCGVSGWSCSYTLSDISKPNNYYVDSNGDCQYKCTVSCGTGWSLIDCTNGGKVDDNNACTTDSCTANGVSHTSITCDPIKKGCPDGSTASCTPSCSSSTGCGTCTPQCPTTPTLSVSLSANPSSGTAPLYNVEFTATVTGTVTGDITYKLDCTNNGDWEASITVPDNPYTFLTKCDYATANTYIAKVEVTRGGQTATGTTTIIVSTTVPSDAKPTASISAPSSATVGQSVSITVTGNDDKNVLALYVDYEGDGIFDDYCYCSGTTKACSNQGTTSCSNVWTKTYTAGTYTLRGRARDSSGQDSVIASTELTVSTTVSKSITVTSPNGGETWTIDTIKTITWTSTGTVGNVDIHISRDNGQTWTDIVTDTANDGSHSWTVTSPATTQALVRVWERADVSVADISNGVFIVSTTPPACTVDANCNDNNSCTQDVCSNSVCNNPNLSSGTACTIDSQSGTCQAGVCVVTSCS